MRTGSDADASIFAGQRIAVDARLVMQMRTGERHVELMRPTILAVQTGLPCAAYEGLTIVHVLGPCAGSGSA